MLRRRVVLSAGCGPQLNLSTLDPDNALVAAIVAQTGSILRGPSVSHLRVRSHRVY